MEVRRRSVKNLASRAESGIGKSKEAIKRVPGGRWQCVHHGKETRNWRKLEDRVEVNEEGTITSRRKRDGTSVGQLGCDWSVRVSWKDIGKRGLGNKAFVMQQPASFP